MFTVGHHERVLQDVSTDGAVEVQKVELSHLGWLHNVFLIEAHLCWLGNTQEGCDQVYEPILFPKIQNLIPIFLENIQKQLICCTVRREKSNIQKCNLQIYFQQLHIQLRASPEYQESVTGGHNFHISRKDNLQGDTSVWRQKARPNQFVPFNELFNPP